MDKNKIQEFTEEEVSDFLEEESSRKKGVSPDVKVGVIAGDELDRIMDKIINEMSKIVTRTMGPYGHNAIIQKMDGVTITKDGWAVAQAANIGESIAEKSLKTIVLDTAASTNIRAGDGTSSTISVAASLHQYIRHYMKTHFINPRDLETYLNDAIERINSELLRTSVLIDSTNLREAIYKIALVSTNWDSNLANMIADIYEKTENPIIKYMDSGSTETYYDIVEGYDLAGQLQLQDAYLTDFDKRLAVTDNPMILVFDNTIGDDLYPILSLLASAVHAKGATLVLITKGFTLPFINRTVAANAQRQKNGQDPIPWLLVHYFASSNMDRECVLDFCDITGAQVIAGDDEVRAEIESLEKEFEESTAKRAKPSSDMKEDPYLALQQHVDDFIMTTMTNVAGAASKFEAGDKSFRVVGVMTDNPMIEKKKKKLTTEINEAMKDATVKTMVTDSIRTKKIRLGKLACKMGVIYVGGRGTAHLKARRDSVDDAIRACEVAYSFGGYTIGGCYAVPHAVYNIFSREKDTLPELTSEFIRDIGYAFFDVCEYVAANKHGNSNVIQTSLVDKMKHAAEVGVALNITTEEPDENLIEPTLVDIEILNGATSLVMTLETTNQYLYTDYENINSSRK